jgi:hypothetical protein
MEDTEADPRMIERPKNRSLRYSREEQMSSFKGYRIGNTRVSEMFLLMRCVSSDLSGGSAGRAQFPQNV